MDNFDYIDQTPPARNVSGIIWNVLTVLVLLMVLCVTVVFLMIFINPNSGINPFPPPTLPSVLELPTATPTPREVLPPTWTPEPTLEPTVTSTPRPTATLPPTETPFSLMTPSLTPSEAPQTSGGYPFALDKGSPVAISSQAFHPEDGCNWMSVAGQALDMSGAPVSTGIVIHLSGVVGGKFMDITSLTGTARQFGEAGYEIPLGDKPIASNGTLWIQLLDQASLPLSDKVFFNTYDDCGKNLIIINFRQVR